MSTTENLKKYQSRNLMKRYFINKFIKRIVNSIADLSELRTILDAGCGEGMVTKEIVSQLPDIKTEGLDISPDALAIARELLPENKLSLGDITKIELPDDSRDLVMALEVLEHLEDPRPAIKELQRVTSKYCLISVPWEPWFSISCLLNGQYLKTWGRYPEHLQFWNKQQISDVVGQYFDIVSVKTSWPWTIVLGVVKKD